MSERNDILEALKDDLSKVTPGDTNYTSYIAEVKRGYYGWSDAVNKPLVCINLLSDTVEEEYIGTQTRQLNIFLYCFMDSDGINKYDKIHTLIRDIEYLLKHDFSHKENTFVKKIGLIEGGVSAPYSYFEMDIEVLYNQEL